MSRAFCRFRSTFLVGSFCFSFFSSLLSWFYHFGCGCVAGVHRRKDAGKCKRRLSNENSLELDRVDVEFYSNWLQVLLANGFK